ncbi:MAG: endonuclease/exonuclease/phosphatase family protein [Pigmentiphaga sp.]|uniref:endonuclease/exonuclease/phosphatase family protein n=1 Tax=Pigmentiphaga sp. TaxID=1977564 RepID=UPI0029A845CB|nr:endonuclease/exonuclease/phosphatase family protein [Pigmentiphaga sp.]MDX3907168.1 endonuclease/exonuclease/phosphatase family protein [Pigmentiphaga sp.]
MRLLNWNIQWGRGVDGRVDLARIVHEAQALGDFDLICLQEVSRGFHPTHASAGLRGGPSADQFAELANLLPGYTVFDAVATDLAPLAPGLPRRQFGNAIACRLPVVRALRHSLPWPPDPAQPSMQRMALELDVHTGFGPLRVVTTHLEFYSETQRMAQVEALRALHAQAVAHARQPVRGEGGDSPFADTGRPVSALVCGDFNSAAGTQAYRRMLEPEKGVPSFRDAWLCAHPGQPHAPTVGLYDHEQWPDGPFACDFVFVTDDLAGRIHRCDVDGRSTASDHQPVALELG